MNILSRTALVVFPVVLTGAFAVAYMTVEQRYVALPAFACLIMVIWLWMSLWERDQEIPFIDVGIICALATLIYTIYPLFNYWVDGLNFGFLSDYRLLQYHITPAELGYFHLRHVLYLFSFVVFYSSFRGSGNIEVGNVCIPSRAAQQTIILFFVLLTVYFLVLKITTGINYDTSYETDAFAKNVSIHANAPLILLQISGKLGGILFLFKLALLYIVVSRCTQSKWRIILLIWITVEILNAFFLGGARTGLVMFLMATALLYHRMISHLSMKFLILLGSVLFVFFIFFGLYRLYSDFSLFKLDFSQTNAGIFSGNNEFQALLGTAYDVSQLKKSGANLPWYLYLNDFIRILPPQQLLPFEKVAASDWYMSEIGLSGTGLGAMWGVISQSIVGLDWIELVLRGAILGFLLARFHRWYVKHQTGFLETLFYMYLCLKIYYTFRDTTFSILSNFIWEIIPFYIMLRLAVGHSFLQTSPSTGEIIPISPNK